MPKRKSLAASSESPTKKARTSGTAKSQTPAAVESFEEFTPTLGFAKKYRVDLKGADVYYVQDVRALSISIFIDLRLKFLVHQSCTSGQMVRGA